MSEESSNNAVQLCDGILASESLPTYSDLRSAIAERDRMLSMARQNIAGDLCALGIQKSAIYAVLTRLDLSAHDASKKESA